MALAEVGSAAKRDELGVIAEQRPARDAASRSSSSRIGCAASRAQL
jgi:hypothetical protein